MRPFFFGCKKYVGNKKKYVALGIRKVKRGASRHDVPSSLYKGPRTWKNFELFPNRLWDLKAKHATRRIYLSPYIKELGLRKIPSSPLRFALVLYTASGT